MMYQIVPMKEKYIESFWNALDSVSKERKYLSFLEAPPMNSTVEYVNNLLQEGAPFFIALAKENVIGWCDISSFDRPIYAHRGELGIGVIAEYRGKGIGEALMRKTIEKGKENGLTRVELSVRQPNDRALTLYKKLGFQIEGVKRDAVYLDGEYEDLIFMALLL